MELKLASLDLVQYYCAICFAVRIGLTAMALPNHLGELWCILNWYVIARGDCSNSLPHHPQILVAVA